MGRKKNTPDVIWSKVNILGKDECWNWLGYVNDDGYGRTWISDKGYYAHRVIYSLTYPNTITMEAPKSKYESGWVLHKCDNPKCCNPDHLFIGTYRDNAVDRAKKGRSANFKGELGPRAKLTNEQAKEIRWIYSKGIATSELMNIYSVSRPTIQGVISMRHYYV